MKTFILTAFLIGVCSAGNGISTRYWDCCKPSCAWPGKASFNGPVQTCAKDGVTVLDANTASACNSGTAYTCNNNQPWAADSNLAYGYVAGALDGLGEWDSCCACYELTFTSGPVSGKKMVVQITNTGGDLGTNHLDIQMPGGGVGIFNGCTSQWGAPSNGWGAQYGGVSTRADCDQLPSQLRAGCYWRFDWFLNADNPNYTYTRVTCPAVLTNNTGCIRNSP